MPATCLPGILKMPAACPHGVSRSLRAVVDLIEHVGAGAITSTPHKAFDDANTAQDDTALRTPERPP
jgi:hypothetical protein